MTTKFRHDNYQRYQNTIQHDQTKMVPEISNIWKSVLSDADRNYYHIFQRGIRQEYQQQVLEYRATGYYTPSTKYQRNHETVGLWTHIQTCDQNALEMEIATYDTVQFPSTTLNEQEQEQRLQVSQEKRKAKLQRQRQDRLLLKSSSSSIASVSVSATSVQPEQQELLSTQAPLPTETPHV
jgi:hypothetical protein